MSGNKKNEQSQQAEQMKQSSNVLPKSVVLEKAPFWFEQQKQREQTQQSQQLQQPAVLCGSGCV